MNRIDLDYTLRSFISTIIHNFCLLEADQITSKKFDKNIDNALKACTDKIMEWN